MLWAIEPIRRSDLRTLTPVDADYLRYGSVYFGHLHSFEIECPGCSQVYAIRRGRRTRVFNRRRQTFRCPACKTQLNLSILAEAPPPAPAIRTDGAHA